MAASRSARSFGLGPPWRPASTVRTPPCGARRRQGRPRRHADRPNPRRTAGRTSHTGVLPILRSSCIIAAGKEAEG